MTTQVQNTDLLVPDIISPEGLEVAECYLAHGGDSKKVAAELNMPIEVVDSQLKKKEVSTYVNRMFSETGFRNKHRIFGLLDQIINLKIDEMGETGLGTSMDIMDVLKVAHKMKMDELKIEAEIAKNTQAAAPTTQTNVQINNLPGSEDQGYMNVLDLLTRKGG